MSREIHEGEKEKARCKKAWGSHEEMLDTKTQKPPRATGKTRCSRKRKGRKHCATNALQEAGKEKGESHMEVAGYA